MKVVHFVESYEAQVKGKHPKLFEGLGKLDGEYHTKLIDDAVLYHMLSTPHGLPLLPKVKAKLEKLER